VLSVALLVLALSPWPAWERSPRVTVVAGEPNTYVLHERACQDR
jgi:hypothetical protein